MGQNIFSEFQPLLASFQKTQIRAKTLLLKEGEVSKKAFIVEKGCLRAWFNNDGRDITTQFFFENEMVASLESLVTNQPSVLNIESIEPTNILVISKKNFLSALNNLPEKHMQNMLLKRLFTYQKLFLSRIKDSPEIRYKDLLENHPDIIHRVPQHYIASYLGITSVSLSRIRNRR